MRRAMTAIMTIGAMALSGCSAPEHAAQDGAAAKPVSVDAKLDTGPAGTYVRTCGYCHGTNVGPIILGRQLPPEAIAMIVRAGQGAMPAFRPTEIDDADLAALAAWISKSPPSDKEHGK